VGREASVKVRCSLTVVFGFVCLATWWRGPFDQCVEDFCSVSRGGVKKKIGRGPIKQCVGDFCFVPRGGVKKRKKIGRGPIEQCVAKFCPLPRGGVKGKKYMSVEVKNSSSVK